MATSTPSGTDRPADAFAEPNTPPSTSSPPAGPPRSRNWMGLGVIVLIAAALLGSGALVVAGMLGDEDQSTMLTHTVARGDLLVTVTEEGNVESAINIDIKCEVAGGTSILWIVEDGKIVEEGELLVELDSSQLEDQINAQRITYEKARAARIQAEEDYAAAVLAVTEYLEGTFQQELQTAEANIRIELENLRSAENALEYSQRMFRRGYISSLELESQEFAVERAQLQLRSAELAKEVLEKFTKQKMVQELESARDSSEAKMQSEQAAFDLEEARLQRLEEQLTKCKIYAPQGGMVVYNNETGGRFGSSQGVTIEEGAAVRERQTILRLPDLDQMQVKVNVHESKVDLLAPGMSADIRILGRDLNGEVVAVANQPAATSWWQGNVKEYATTVRILGSGEGLKPGMTAECQIHVSEANNVLILPVACVVEQGGEYYCWVDSGRGSPERRALLLTATNDSFVAVEDGVQEGEKIVLNPRASIDEAKPDSLEADSAGGAGSSDDADEGSAETGGPGERGGRSPGERGGPGAGSPGGGGGPGAGGAGGRRGGGGGDLSQFDTDGDGSISREEAPSWMQENFERFDPNGDGIVDAEEMSARRGGGGGRPGGGGGDGGGGDGGGGGGGGGMDLSSLDQDGDGQISREEAPERMQQFFDQIDSNGDGLIDQSELEALRSRFGGGG